MGPTCFFREREKRFPKITVAEGSVFFGNHSSTLDTNREVPVDRCWLKCFFKVIYKKSRPFCDCNLEERFFAFSKKTRWGPLISAF